MPSLVAYGHSYVDGDGASAPSRCFAALVGEALSCTVQNEAIGGSLSVRTAEQVTVDKPPPAVYYLLMTGVNDARLYGDRADALADCAEALETIFETFSITGPLALVVAVEQPYLLDYTQHAPHDKGSDALVDRYNEKLRQVARRYPQVVLAAAVGWDPTAMIADDTVHLNDLGHRELAAAVYRVAKGASGN